LNFTRLKQKKPKTEKQEHKCGAKKKSVNTIDNYGVKFFSKLSCSTQD